MMGGGGESATTGGDASLTGDGGDAAFRGGDGTCGGGDGAFGGGDGTCGGGDVAFGGGEGGRSDLDEDVDGFVGSWLSSPRLGTTSTTGFSPP